VCRVACFVASFQVECIGPKRGDTGASGAADRMLSTLLVHMDGMISASASAPSSQLSMFVVAATADPTKLDDALLRPG